MYLYHRYAVILCDKEAKCPERLRIMPNGQTLAQKTVLCLRCQDFHPLFFKHRVARQGQQNWVIIEPALDV